MKTCAEEILKHDEILTLKFVKFCSVLGAIFLPSNKTSSKQERAFQRCLDNSTSLAIMKDRNLIIIFKEWMRAYTHRIAGCQIMFLLLSVVFTIAVSALYLRINNNLISLREKKFSKNAMMHF